MTCKECFDEHLTARSLAEQCAAVSVTWVSEPVLKALITFTCVHGRTHRHSVYPGTDDWTWCEYVTDDWWRGIQTPQAA
jgi:hypothetical protein